MRRSILTLAASALLLSAAAAPLAHAFGVGLQPATVEMTMREGDRQRQTITIGNVHTEKTISLQLSLADWTLDSDGELVLSPPGESERSGADWVRFSPAQVTLKPETSQDVTVEIVTPHKVGTKGDHRFALLATTMLPEDRGGASGVWSKYQLASLFYLTFRPSKSLATVDALELGEDGLIRMALRNDGDAHARIQGKALVKGSDGKVVADTEVNTVILEDSSRELAFGFADLPSGEYSVDFDLRNVYAPQNDFRPVTVKAGTVEYVAP